MKSVASNSSVASLQLSFSFLMKTLGLSCTPLKDLNHLHIKYIQTGVILELSERSFATISGFQGEVLIPVHSIHFLLLPQLKIGLSASLGRLSPKSPSRMTPNIKTLFYAEK